MVAAGTRWLFGKSVGTKQTFDGICDPSLEQDRVAGGSIKRGGL